MLLATICERLPAKQVFDKLVPSAPFASAETLQKGIISKVNCPGLPEVRMSPRATGFRVKSLRSQKIGRGLALAILMILFSSYLEEDTGIKRGSRMYSRIDNWKLQRF